MKKKTIIADLTQNDQKKFMVKTQERLTLVLIALGNAESSVEVNLVEAGAQADIYGIVIGANSNTPALHTYQNHLAPQTTSNLLVKSALFERSRFSYEGYIRVHKKAQHADAYQRNENLMLSPEAKADSKPALEILANDVRCTHSATVGKVDEEQLFYLRSRGISRKRAYELLIEGFYTPIFEKIGDDLMVKRIRKVLDKQLLTMIHGI
ncbi:SufD family Fe-S cluster assembly protein [Candidatus Gottesmanbacteria bacterium]|nr:SufD family Fe-S cluster assembly protein [Candidatus Gottesmanbacteria bacterium]